MLFVSQGNKLYSDTLDLKPLWETHGIEDLHFLIVNILMFLLFKYEIHSTKQ